MKLSRLLVGLFTIAFSLNSYAQQDPCQLQISLLTCSPGDELYSTFGHTAIRVKDPASGTDVVFNYGTFDDSNPTEFYTKFTKGIMEYALSAYPFSDFLEEYKYYQRGVIEQTLDLPCAAKQQLFVALQLNATESKRYYNYYFHEDNCTTRAKLIIEKNALSPVTYKRILPPSSPTFRNLVHIYLDSGHHYWNKLGIDILLGSNLDKQATNEQAMFLPDLLLKGFDNAVVNNHPLVKSKQTILTIPVKENTGSWFTPVIFFWILFALITLASFSNKKSVRPLLNGFDILFFLLLGLLGTVIVVLWIIRVDTVCRDNFNILWALPAHLPMAFLLFRKKAWVKNYLRFTLILSALTLAAWTFLPQQLNTALIPVLLLIIVRAFFRSKKK